MAGSKTVTTVTAYITLNWPAATDAAEYRVFRSDDGTVGSYQRIAKIKASTSPTYTDETVTAGETYYYHVDALYPGYRLAEIHTVAVMATTGAVSGLTPGTVSRPTASRKDSDATTINVSWSAPSGATSGTRYDVEYQSLPAGGSWSGWTSLSTEQTATTYTLSNAGGGTTYRIQVRAVNIVGDKRYTGSWSSYATVAPLANPELVQGLTAVRDDTDDTEITVSWKKPAAGTAPTSYEVEQQSRDGNSGSWSVWANVATVTHDDDTTTFTHTVSNATGAKSYQFQVRTVTVSGNDTIYGGWKTVGPVRALPAPGQVGSLQATRNATKDTEITVTWDAPSSGTTPTGYELQYQENGGAWLPQTPTPVTGTSHTFSAKGGSRYVFQVRAYKTLADNVTKLPGSYRSSNTVAGKAAGNIETVTAERQTNGVADPDSTTIKVTWTESARATVGYDVEYRKDSGSWVREATHIASGQNASREYTYENADGLEKYTFRVRGVSGAGNGAWTESAQVDQPPVKYTGVDVFVDYITVKVTSGPWWYKYQAHDGWTSCAKVAAGGHHTIRNLMPERKYQVDLFKTSACNWNDSSDNFQDIYVTTLSDINDWGQCWNTADCRSIDNPNDFNNHTHKRQFLAAFGVTTSGCDFSTRKHHTHGWPDGGWGPHWHCDTR